MKFSKTITRMLWLLNKGVVGKLAIACVLGLSIATAPLALAGYDSSHDSSTPKPESVAANGTRYVPPANPSSPSSPTGTTGRRGIPRGSCTGEAETVLTALAPYKHVGQTSSTHPTFAWFVPDSQSFPMEFRLYEYGASGERILLQTIELESTPGIMTQSLPKDKPGLSIGQRYRWQVVIVCDPNSPSNDLVAGAEIEVVEMQPDLQAALSTTTDRLERANLYAKAGLWYNALGEALRTTETARTREYVLGLLEDLVQVEEPKESGNQSVQSERLSKVVAIERERNSSLTH